MVQKLKDAANLLKAKIKQDDLQELLTQVTSEQNWQASTNQLHEVANAAYNYQKWQKINDFIWDKLKKSKSWRKILKSLNLVDFLLKNGPPSIISSFKYDIYQFRSFDNYSHYSDGIDRGEAIRDKSKVIVQLLSNQQLLEQQRVKAKNIREKMAGMGGTTNYGGYGANTGGMGGSSWGGSKYQSYNNKNVGSVNTGNSGGNYGNLGVYGDYGSHKSTLDKYKDVNAKKTTTNNTSINNISSNIQSETAPIAQNKKPFEKIAPKLGKPGSKPAPKAEEHVKPQEQQQTTNQNTGLIDDIFSLPQPEKPQQLKNNNNVHIQQNQPVAQQQNQGWDMGQLLGGGSSQTSPPQNNNININQQQNIQVNQQQNHQVNQQQNHQNVFIPIQGQTFNQVGQYTQPNQFPIQLGQPQMSNVAMYGNPGMHGNMGMYGNVGLQGQGNMGMQGQYGQAYQMNYGVQQQNYYQQNTYQQPQNQKNNIQISLSSGNNKKDEQDFGGFESGNKNGVNWLSSTEKNLTDFSDFGAQMKKTTSNSKSNENNIKLDNWDW